MQTARNAESAPGLAGDHHRVEDIPQREDDQKDAHHFDDFFDAHDEVASGGDLPSGSPEVSPECEPTFIASADTILSSDFRCARP
jgi:hypothetical protein